MEKVKELKEAINKAIDMEAEDEEASDRAFYKAYGEYKKLMLQYNPHVIPIAKQLVYFYGDEGRWRVGITCKDIYYTKNGWDYPDKYGWVRPPITEAAYQAQTEAYDRNNMTVNEELRQKMLRCFLDQRPQCLAADGLNVIESIEGLTGFADFLMKIHDGDAEKRKELLEWARSQGWNGRTLKPENIL